MPNFTCKKCERSSLVRSNFKLTIDKRAYCVKCWPKRDLVDADKLMVSSAYGCTKNHMFNEGELDQRLYEYHDPLINRA
jgi:hypothetical protein